MRRNCELLQQLDKELEVFREPAHGSMSGSGRGHHLDLDAYSREESMKLLHGLFLLRCSEVPCVVVF